MANKRIMMSKVKVRSGERTSELGAQDFGKTGKLTA